MSNFFDIRNLKFILNEMLNVGQLTDYDRFSEYDVDTFNMLLDSTEDYAEQELYPTFKEMDDQPAYYKDGKIIVHPMIGKAMQYAGEQGAIGSGFDYEDGGMQMPAVISAARGHILESANNNVVGYIGLTTGAAELIVEFGSEELKSYYVPKMLTGSWAGTMCLTEPQAGSSLSDVTTKAVPDGDYYKISGQKIFISGGDHEYCDNFVHLVLARIEGAPAGTKGISLFVVPKYRQGADGSLVDNDVITAGDFQKLGQRGYCTTHLAFGDEGDCHGWLVGEENKGLKNMFLMMNGARIAVGVSGASIATAAYHHALQYAKERPQGRRIQSGGNKDVNKDQVLIIKHPDVRRMLLLQKAVAEGSVSLIMQASLYRDLADVTEGEEKEKYDQLLEILTPIVKTYPAEMGREAVSNGLQVLGGYGFTNDFLLQQYYRDIRIMSLYEGTTGIQSLDLLGRKVVMNNGQAIRILMKEIMTDIARAKSHEALSSYADELGSSLAVVQKSLEYLLAFAMKGENERFLADATIFMQLMSNVIIAWQWLKQATTASDMMSAEDGLYTEDYYRSKIHTMKYFFKYELPKIHACAEILKGEELTMYAEDRVFVFEE